MSILDSLWPGQARPHVFKISHDWASTALFRMSFQRLAVPTALFCEMQFQVTLAILELGITPAQQRNYYLKSFQVYICQRASYRNTASCIKTYSLSSHSKCTICRSRGSCTTYPMPVTLPFYITVIVQDRGTHTLEMPTDLGELKRCTQVKHAGFSLTHPFFPLLAPQAACFTSDSSRLSRHSVLMDCKASLGLLCVKP